MSKPGIFARVFAHHKPEHVHYDLGAPLDELARVVENRTLPPCTCLELGCRHGSDAIYLSTKDFEVTAVDVSANNIKICHQKAMRAKAEVNWIVSDVMKFEPKHSFDFILDKGCFQHLHIRDRAKYVEKVHSWLRPKGGLMLVCLSNKNPTLDPGIYNLGLIKLYDFLRIKEPHYTSQADLRKLFSDKFDIFELKEIRLFNHWGSKHIFNFCMMNKRS